MFSTHAYLAVHVVYQLEKCLLIKQTVDCFLIPDYFRLFFFFLQCPVQAAYPNRMVGLVALQYQWQICSTKGGKTFPLLHIDFITFVKGGLVVQGSGNKLDRPQQVRIIINKDYETEGKEPERQGKPERHRQQ
ncbi:hypothetical protein CHARACLAT_028078 [Characodon lateralis]|uniref:Uncharacterized protein n=1 Tax=Characodon lateralis TaxID=208331 RepID=A0ABU7EQK2_9TELE|nr:hypothetical protein [Characodon lateralis]